jgi:hypothetical protein
VGFAGAVDLEDVLAGRGFGFEGLLDAEDAPVALIKLLDGLDGLFERLALSDDLLVAIGDDLLEASRACVALFVEATVICLLA